MKESLFWGRYTWALFHCLVEKIKDEHFLNELDNVKNIVNTVCNHLPCPYCRKHATDYLLKYKFMTLNTKEEMKFFFFCLSQ